MEQEIIIVVTDVEQEVITFHLMHLFIVLNKLLFSIIHLNTHSNGTRG